MSNIEQSKDNPVKGFMVMLTLIFVLLVFTPVDTVAKKPKLSKEHEDFYKYARYLFTKLERKVFKNLPDDKSRDEFIRNFWEIRDPNPVTEENEFKVEMERRLEYVSYYLKEGPVPGWKTDRGRIYLLLGEPASRYQHFPSSSFRRVIYWYYWESEIYVKFVDPNGNGRYDMDLRNTSLSLLDELEKRKYYIQNPEKKDGFEIGVLKFNAAYNKEKKSIRIIMNPKNLNFEEGKDGKTMIAKLNVNMIIYPKKAKYIKKKTLETLKIPKEKLLEKKYKITLDIPVELPKGKIEVDIIVSDYLGDAVKRKFLKIKH